MKSRLTDTFLLSNQDGECEIIAAGKDPVAFRLALLEDKPRHAGVLRLAAEKAGWAPATGEPLLEPLRALFEPIMLQTNEICDGIGYPVELVIGAERVVLDFPKRTVREPIPDEKAKMRSAATQPHHLRPFPRSLELPLPPLRPNAKPPPEARPLHLLEQKNAPPACPQFD